MGLDSMANQYWAVRQSRNPCLVGLSGIVIYESENGFRVITRGNKLKSGSVSLSPSASKGTDDGPTVLPKQNAVFVFGVPLFSTTTETVSDVAHVELELYGNQFRFRSSDRASRKFKHKESIVL